MRPEYESWICSPGPQRMLAEAVDALTGKATVWFCEELPWREEFRRSVKDVLGTADSRLNIEFVDAGSTDKEPIEVVFDFDGSAQDLFLPAYDLARFIKDNKVLENTVLWIFGMQPETCSSWLEFSRELARLGASLKIVCEGVPSCSSAKNVKVISTGSFISEFDLLLYAMMLCQNDKNASELKMYAARLAVNLSAGRPKTLSELIFDVDRLIDNPEKTARDICVVSSDEDIRSAVRNAQMMSILPKTEERRAVLVGDLKDRLEPLLPFDDDFDNKITVLDEIELRHIVYFRNMHEIYLNDAENEELKLLYGVRNDISHRKIVPGTNARMVFLKS